MKQGLYEVLCSFLVGNRRRCQNRVKSAESAEREENEKSRTKNFKNTTKNSEEKRK